MFIIILAVSIRMIYKKNVENYIFIFQKLFSMFSGGSGGYNKGYQSNQGYQQNQGYQSNQGNQGNQGYHSRGYQNEHDDRDRRGRGGYRGRRWQLYTR